MPAETTVADDASNKPTLENRSPVGSWEMHSWGNGKFSSMAAVSAITTLQIGATLAPIPADQVALNKAAEYLLDALASQLKPFLQALAVDSQTEAPGIRIKAAMRGQADPSGLTWRIED